MELFYTVTGLGLGNLLLSPGNRKNGALFFSVFTVDTVCYKVETQYIEIGNKEGIIRLRKSLFWDVPSHTLDLDRNKRLILERVFSRGNIDEFRSVNKYYSKEEIREAVRRIGTLDKKTLHFLSKTYQIKPGDFRCCKKNL